MQSSASESFARALRNPTVLAMLGSAGVHILLILISALKPAEGQPQRFQIVNLPPKASANKLATNPNPTSPNPNGSNLPVPNGLPPVSSSDIPQIGDLPDLSTFRMLPSQSSVPGINQGFGSSIDLNRIRPMDLPQRSFPKIQRPQSGKTATPDDIMPLQPPGNEQLPALSSEKFQSLPSNSNPSQFSTADKSKLPALASTPFSAQEFLYGQQPPQSSSTPNASVASSNTPGTESTNNAPTGSSLESRTKLTRTVESQRLRVFQKFSLQKGPLLKATYPQESCSNQKNGTATVYALYGPDGAISTESDAIQVTQSAPNEAMDQAAIARVSSYRPEARGVYQAFTFPVDIVCQAAQPKPSPSPSPTQSPNPKGQSASPRPSTSPSNLPSGSPQSPSSTPTPSASQFPSQSPSSLPLAPTSNPVPSSSQPSSVSPSAPVPEAPTPPETPSPAPASLPPSTPTQTTTPSAPSLEPVPSPSIAVPESAPVTPSTTP
jgi:hypothetical protein